MTAPEHMTTREAAEALGCSTRTVQRMVDDGRLTPAQKFPGETGPYLFDRAEVEQLAATLAEGRRSA